MAPTISIGGIHLVNSNGTPTAGGAATAASTTPFAIRHGWTLATPEPLPIWGGGPPFVPGRRLAYSSYDNVVERIPISVVGSSHENAVTRVQELKRALATVSATTPAVFSVQPTGSSTAMASDVYSAFVREVTEQASAFEAWEGWVEYDAEIVLSRAPFWAALSSGETVINAQSINNNFSGSPDNIVAYTTGSGDLIYEGQPLNLAMTNASGGTLSNQNLYLGSIDSITTDATTQSVTTSSTTGASAGTGDTITVGTVLDAKQATKMRLIGQCSSVSANSEMRLKVYLSSSTPAPFYTGPWFAPTTNDGRYDAGTVPSAIFRDTALTTLYVVLEVRSTTGGSVTITLSNFYVVYYYSLCKVSGLDSILNTTGVVHVRGFVATSNRPCLPLRKAEAYVLNSGSQTYYGRVDGTPPIYVSGASLWLMAVDKTSGAPSSATFTTTATQSALWKTLRGND
jgi:hypothetical protein